jgi:hypothetical protein
MCGELTTVCFGFCGDETFLGGRVPVLGGIPISSVLRMSKYLAFCRAGFTKYEGQI